MSTASSAIASATADAGAFAASPWRLGDQFRLASLSIGSASFFLAAFLAYLGDPRPAFLALIGGAGLGIAIGRVAYVIPRVLDTPLTGSIPVWAALGLWHGGVSILALAWRELVPPPVGIMAGLMLAASAALLLDRLVRMLRDSPRRLSNGWKVGLALLVPTGICAVATGVMLGLSFRDGFYSGLPDIALSLLVFGSLLPAGTVALALRPPRG